MGLKESGLRGSLRNVSVGIDAIPDSSVERGSDNDTSGPRDDQVGLIINSDDEWVEIDGRISGNTSGITRAYVYDVANENLHGDVDISSLSAGDTFTVDLDDPIQPDTDYYFLADAEGSNYDAGLRNIGDETPIESDDGRLRIIDGASGFSSSPNAFNIDKVGNLR